MRWKLLVVVVAVVCGACSGGAYDPADSDFAIAAPGIELEQGVTYRYKFFIHCGMEWLHDFNGQAWHTDRPIYDGSGRTPDSLRDFLVNPDEVISPEVWTHITLVVPDEIQLTLPDGSRDSIYQPSDDEWPGCA